MLRQISSRLVLVLSFEIGLTHAEVPFSQIFGQDITKFLQSLHISWSRHRKLNSSFQNKIRSNRRFSRTRFDSLITFSNLNPKSNQIKPKTTQPTKGLVILECIKYLYYLKIGLLMNTILNFLFLLSVLSKKSCPFYKYFSI